MTCAARLRILLAVFAAGALAGCVTAPTPEPIDLTPRVTSRVFPDYPEAAKREGIEGTVTVWLYVREDGTVERIEARSSPNELLTSATVEALRRWRFETPVENGRRVPFRVEYSVEFSLTDALHVAAL